MTREPTTKGIYSCFSWVTCARVRQEISFSFQIHIDLIVFFFFRYRERAPQPAVARFFNKTRDLACQYYLLSFWKNERLFTVGRPYLPPAY